MKGNEAHDATPANLEKRFNPERFNGISVVNAREQSTYT